MPDTIIIVFPPFQYCRCDERRDVSGASELICDGRVGSSWAVSHWRQCRTLDNIKVASLFTWQRMNTVARFSRTELAHSAAKQHGATAMILLIVSLFGFVLIFRESGKTINIWKDTKQKKGGDVCLLCALRRKRRNGRLSYCRSGLTLSSFCVPTTRGQLLRGTIVR